MCYRTTRLDFWVKREKLSSMREINVFGPQAWDSRIMHESWQVYMVVWVWVCYILLGWWTLKIHCPEFKPVCWCQATIKLNIKLERSIWSPSLIKECSICNLIPIFSGSCCQLPLTVHVTATSLTQSPHISDFTLDSQWSELYHLLLNNYMYEHRIVVCTNVVHVERKILSLSKFEKNVLCILFPSCYCSSTFNCSCDV